jgi:hypothetical protein
MRRELTPVEQDVLRLIKGGGPYPALAVSIAIGSQYHDVKLGTTTVLSLRREGIVIDNLDGAVGTSWTMEEILQGWKEV